MKRETATIEVHAPDNNGGRENLEKSNSRNKVEDINNNIDNSLTSGQNSIIDINPFELLNTIDQNVDTDEGVTNIENKNGKDPKKREREINNSPKRENKTSRVNKIETALSVKPKTCNAASLSSEEKVSP